MPKETLDQEFLELFHKANRSLRNSRNATRPEEAINTVQDCEEIGLRVVGVIPHNSKAPSTKRVVLIGPLDCPV